MCGIYMEIVLLRLSFSSVKRSVAISTVLVWGIIT